MCARLFLVLFAAWPGLVAIAEEKIAADGVPAPLFDAGTLTGEGSVALQDHLGKVLLVDFWASWCAPCRESLPAFEQIRNEVGTDDFEVIAVNVDKKARDGLDFLEQYPVTYPVAHDPEGNIARIYAVKGMPMSYLVDRQGTIRLVHEGFNNKHIPRLKAAIAELVAEEGT